MLLIDRLADTLRSWRDYSELPPAAKSMHKRDRRGLQPTDPGADLAVRETVGWLERAQDNSISRDGGVARHYSLVSGWASSYPETTGYIVPTMIQCGDLNGSKELLDRAETMLNWLVEIQLPGGGYQGGLIDSTPVVPVIFNTGQILMGLASGVQRFGTEYSDAMIRAADWLVRNQDSDGSWRKHISPFVAPGEKAYHTHVAWGLFQAAEAGNDKTYADAGLKNVQWALSLQTENGWIKHCCLDDNSAPLTHTIGYCLRGIIEAYRATGLEDLLVAIRKTADGVLRNLGEDGFLAGRFDKNWNAVVPWACLTGTVQLAHCWLLMYQITGNFKYRDGGFLANEYVRRTVDFAGPAEIRGGIRGSFPISGRYGQYEYLDWAAKFFIDSNLLEMEIRDG